MKTEHLTNDELDLLLLGEEVATATAEHARACLVCRRRVEEWRRAMTQPLGADPTPATRRQVREAALAAWAAPRPRRRPVWWWAAAAALVVALSLPLLRWGGGGGGEVDAVAVLAEVEALLAADPVDAAFPPDLVTALAAEPEGNGAGSTS
jgi:hypothetical protein